MFSAAAAASHPFVASMNSSFLESSFTGATRPVGRIPESMVSLCLDKTNETLDSIESQLFPQSSSSNRSFTAKVYFDNLVSTHYVQYALEAALALIKTSPNACHFHVSRGSSFLAMDKNEERSLYFYMCLKGPQQQPHPQLIKSLKKASEEFFRSICTGWKESTNKGVCERALEAVGRDSNHGVTKVYVRECRDKSVAFIEGVARQLGLDICQARFNDTNVCINQETKTYYVEEEDGQIRSTKDYNSIRWRYMNNDYLVGSEDDIQRLFEFVTKSYPFNQESTKK